MKKWNWFVLMIGIGSICVGIGFASALELHGKTWSLCMWLGLLISGAANALLRKELANK